MNQAGMDVQALRKLLQEKRVTLRESAASREDSTAAVELDQTRLGRLSRMDALQTQAMAQETQRRDVAELRRVEAALERFDSGEYGSCLRCGEQIAEQRLEVDPAATLCIGCASAAEQ